MLHGLETVALTKPQNAKMEVAEKNMLFSHLERGLRVWLYV